jgi:antitoxin ParD1/3/4
MSRNTSISLGDYLSAFVDDQIASGRYASASDVLRAGLRLLEERETRIAEHCAWLREGEVTGERSSPSAFGAELDALAAEEEREARTRALKQALQEGMDSGPPQPFDFDAFLAGKHARRVRNA